MADQLATLKARYGVHTRRDLVRAIRDDYDRETLDEGEAPTPLKIAEIYLDRMLEAEYEKNMAAERQVTGLVLGQMQRDMGVRPVCIVCGRPADHGYCEAHA